MLDLKLFLQKVFKNFKCLGFCVDGTVAQDATQVAQDVTQVAQDVCCKFYKMFEKRAKSEGLTLTILLKLKKFLKTILKTLNILGYCVDGTDRPRCMF